MANLTDRAPGIAVTPLPSVQTPEVRAARERVNEAMRAAHWNDNRITPSEIGSIVDAVASDGISIEELTAVRSLLEEARRVLPRLISEHDAAKAASDGISARVARGEVLTKDEFIAIETRYLEAVDALREGQNQIPAYDDLMQRLMQIYARTAPRM